MGVMMLRFLSVLPLCVALGACATRYQEVDASLPHATITFEKGYRTGAGGYGAVSMQSYTFADNEGCTNMVHAAAFAWVTGASHSRRVRIDQPVYVQAHTEYEQVTGVRSEGIGVVVAESAIRECLGSASFTPEAGHAYRVVQEELSYGVCEMRVVDVATGAPPPGLTATNGKMCVSFGKPEEQPADAAPAEPAG
jgi:hypothetical protein